MANTKITSRVIADDAVGIPALAVSDGSNGQVLTTNGSGTLSFSTVSGTTINNNADNRVITGSGTANTLEGEANFVFDGSKLGVGTASPLKTVDIAGSAPYIRITDTRQASWSAGDKFGGIEWYLEDTSANGPLVGASIYAENAQSSALPDQNLIFATAPHNDASGPTERMRILSSGGLTFNGDTATANALDDYEEGTWTPALDNITTNSSTMYGIYTKIGNICHIHAKISATVASLPGAQFQISGLPFAATNTSDTGQRAIITIGGDCSNTGAAVNGRAQFITNSSTLQGIYLNSGTTATFTYNIMDSTTFELHIHGFYTTT